MRTPHGRCVYLDSSVVVYAVERHPVYYPMVRHHWLAAEEGRSSLVTSELAVMEALVMPLRLRRESLQEDYENVLFRGHLTLLPVDQLCLRAAAQLRADHEALRTPDAIHLAAALQAGCDLFVTNDRRLARVPGLRLAVLSDLSA